MTNSALVGYNALAGFVVDALGSPGRELASMRIQYLPALLLSVLAAGDCCAATNQHVSLRSTNAFAMVSRTNRAVVKSIHRQAHKPYVATGQLALNNISNQLAVLTAKKKQVNAEYCAKHARWALEYRAGRPPNQKAVLDYDARVASQLHDIDRQTAALALKAMDVRKLYRLP